MSTSSQKSRIAFGKGAEYYIFSKMMFEGLNVYPSLIDDHGIDALVECPDGRICKVQVKAVSSDARDAKRPLFAAIEHPFIAIDDYWFVFYAEEGDRIWIMTSKEFLGECSRNSGAAKNKNKCSIKLGKNRDKYIVKDFSRLINNITRINDMSIFDPKTNEEHVREFDEHIRGDKGLIGFTTQDGKKHVGWYAPIYNPCGDIGDPESVVELYKDIYGNEYKGVKETFTVTPFCCFYKTHSNGEYCLLKYPIYENDANENPLRLFDESYRKALIEDDEPVRHSLRQRIREWLLINTQCPSSVYIENDFSVRSDAPILIHPSAKDSIPEYIKIKG